MVSADSSSPRNLKSIQLRSTTTGEHERSAHAFINVCDNVLYFEILKLSAAAIVKTPFGRDSPKRSTILNPSIKKQFEKSNASLVTFNTVKLATASSARLGRPKTELVSIVDEANEVRGRRTTCSRCESPSWRTWRYGRVLFRTKREEKKKKKWKKNRRIKYIPTRERFFVFFFHSRWLLPFEISRQGPDDVTILFQKQFWSSVIGSLFFGAIPDRVRVFSRRQVRVCDMREHSKNVYRRTFVRFFFSSFTDVRYFQKSI